MVPHKHGFPTVSPARCRDASWFFVLAPNQNSGWALVNSSTGLSVSAGNACVHLFANRRKRSVRSRPSSVRVTGQTSQMRVSETARNRARVKAAVASAAVMSTTMIRAADAAESPKLTTPGMQQNCTSSIPCLAMTSTYIVKISVVFLARHRGPIGDDDNLHVLGLADDSLYRISGQ